MPISIYYEKGEGDKKSDIARPIEIGYRFHVKHWGKGKIKWVILTFIFKCK